MGKPRRRRQGCLVERSTPTMLPRPRRGQPPQPRNASCSSGSSPIDHPDTDQRGKSFGRPAGRVWSGHSRRENTPRRLARRHGSAAAHAQPTHRLRCCPSRGQPRLQPCGQGGHGAPPCPPRFPRWHKHYWLQKRKSRQSREDQEQCSATPGGKRVHLRAPHQTHARPAMEEDHQRSVGWPAFDVVRCLTGRAERARDHCGGGHRRRRLRLNDRAYRNQDGMSVERYPGTHRLKWNCHSRILRSDASRARA